MPSVSTFDSANIPPGDGGGVCATARTALRESSLRRSGSGRGGEAERLVGDVEIEWVRLIFFVGGECWLSLVEGGERADREPPGSVMPSDDSDTDFRRVL